MLDTIYEQDIKKDRSTIVCMKAKQTRSNWPTRAKTAFHHDFTYCILVRTSQQQQIFRYQWNFWQ